MRLVVRFPRFTFFNCFFKVVVDQFIHQVLYNSLCNKWDHMTVDQFLLTVLDGKGSGAFHLSLSFESFRCCIACLWQCFFQSKYVEHFWPDRGHWPVSIFNYSFACHWPLVDSVITHCWRWTYTQWAITLFSINILNIGFCNHLWLNWVQFWLYIRPASSKLIHSGFLLEFVFVRALWSILYLWTTLRLPFNWVRCPRQDGLHYLIFPLFSNGKVLIMICIWTHWSHWTRLLALQC